MMLQSPSILPRHLILFGTPQALISRHNWSYRVRSTTGWSSSLKVIHTVHAAHITDGHCYGQYNPIFHVVSAVHYGISSSQYSCAVYGLRMWNRLSSALRLPELSLSPFKRQLKTAWLLQR